MMEESSLDGSSEVDLVLRSSKLAERRRLNQRPLRLGFLPSQEARRL